MFTYAIIWIIVGVVVNGIYDLIVGRVIINKCSFIERIVRIIFWPVVCIMILFSGDNA